MRRALGVWCKKEEVLFAVADDAKLVDDPRQRIRAPAVLEASEALEGLLDDVGRVIAEVRPDVVRVLQPEATYEGSYPNLAPRAALETLVRLAAVRASVPVEMLHRATARSRVGMARRGRFEDQISAIIPAPVGRYWTAGRRLAAIAAVSEPS